MSQKQKWLLVGVVLVALFFRYYQIIQMPGGLFPDEAANGLDINLMQQGHLQPFYERGNGREALFFYMLWASVSQFGKGPWQHHIVSALVGVLAVIFCFLVTRKLFSLFSEDQIIKERATSIGLLAAFLMAVSSWHVVLSRTAFRANLIPLFTALALYLFLETVAAEKQRARLVWALCAGASFALGFYTYIAYRVMVPIMGMIVFWPLLADSVRQPRLEGLKKNWKAGLLFLVSFMVVIYPIAHYFYTHPGSFVGRSGQVSVFNTELNQGNLGGAIMTVAKESMLAYFTNGDLNWRHNIYGFPFLSPLISPFFAIGLILITLLGIRYFFNPKKRPNDWKYFLLTGWFWGMLLPVITTAEGIPHGLRSIGTIPVVFIITAWGIHLVVRLAMKAIDFRHGQTALWKKRLIGYSLMTLPYAFVATLILQTYFAYFVYAANSPENFYAFRSDLTSVSEYLKSKGNKLNTYLVLDKFSLQTTDYITSADGAYPEDPANQPYRQVDPEDSWKLANLKAEDKIVFTQSSLFDIKKFKQYHKDAALTLECRNKFEQTTMAVYIITPVPAEEKNIANTNWLCSQIIIY